MNAAEKALAQYEEIKGEVDFILNYFERGLTYNRAWLENRLVELSARVLDIERGKPVRSDVTVQVKSNRKGAVAYQARRAKMTAQERFEYDYPDFEG